MRVLSFCIIRKNNKILLQVEQMQPVCEWENKTVEQCLPEINDVLKRNGALSFFEHSLFKAYKKHVDFNYSAYESITYRIFLPENHAQLLTLIMSLDAYYKKNHQYDADYLLFGKESIANYIVQAKRVFGSQEHDAQYLKDHGAPPAETMATLSLPVEHFVALANTYNDALFVKAEKTIAGYLWSAVQSNFSYAWNKFNEGYDDTPQKKIEIQCDDECVESIKTDKSLIAEYLTKQFINLSSHYSFLEAFKLSYPDLPANERVRIDAQLKEYARGPIEVLDTLKDFIKAKGQSELSEEVEEVCLIENNLFNMPSTTNYGSFFAPSHNPIATSSAASEADERVVASILHQPG